MGRYLRDILGRYTRIVVWGTGNFYTLYKELLDRRVVYFVDNNADKWGSTLNRKDIFPPEKLKEESVNETLVIVCNHYFEEISVQIKQYGDFDLIDIVTMELVQQKERKLEAAGQMEAGSTIAICGGIHAMWQTNGSREFIDGQLGQLHQAGFHTVEIVPLLYYQSGKRESSVLAVSSDGRYQGIFTAEELAGLSPKVRGMVIHSLYYSHGTMRALLDSVEVETSILYYIHDYSCLCFNRFLHRDKRLCIDMDGNMGCPSCTANEERKSHLQFHQSVFERHNVLLIAPSEDTWARVEEFYKNIQIKVIPHLKYDYRPFTKRTNSPLRIAYTGTAIWHKGWEQFAGLVDRFGHAYDFYCLGECPDDLRIQNVTYIPVRLPGSGSALTMTEALQKYSIDIAYIGSVWPETYSYTYYEAYEAGCFILTSTKSGNVYRQVIKNENGIAFSCEDDMAEWLAGDTVQRDVQSLDKRITNVRNNEEFLIYFK